MGLYPEVKTSAGRFIEVEDSNPDKFLRTVRNNWDYFFFVIY